MLSGRLSECQTVRVQISVSVMIWIKTVCKIYQHMINVASSKERLKRLIFVFDLILYVQGAQWLSGRVLDSKPRHIYPCLLLVQPRKTRPCLTERLLMGRKESN